MAEIPSNPPPGRKGFTNEWIAGLKTLPDRREYSDESGLDRTPRDSYRRYLRLRHEGNTGRKTWGLWLTTDGQRRWIRLGGVNIGVAQGRLTLTVEQALDWTKDVIEAHRNGNLKAVLAELEARNAPVAPVATVPPAEAKTVGMAFGDPEVGFYALRILSGRKRRRRPETVKRDFERFILPEIGDRACTDPEMEDLCRRLIARKAKEHAVRAGSILQLLKQFFSWCGRSGWLRGPGGIRLASPVDGLMPDDLGIEQAQERERWLTDEEIRAFWHGVLAPRPSAPRRHGAGYGGSKVIVSLQRARGLEAITAYALRFLLVVPVRTSSLLLAERSEIDWDRKVWSIPCDHLKLTTTAIRKRKNRPLDIPLSPLALDLLRSMFAEGGTSRWVVASPRNRRTGTDKHMSDKALSHALRRMLRRGNLTLPGDATFPPFTPHDLRRTCRTLMSRLRQDEKVAERCLGHATDGKVEGTYNRWDYAEEIRGALEAVATLVQEVVGVTPPVKRTGS